MLNNNKSKLIIITFILILVIVFISVVFILTNFKFQKKQSNSSLVLKNKITSINNTINFEKPPKVIANQYKNYNWRIKIDKINLDAPILEGTDKETLRKGVGHFTNTGISNGNICLAAHNRGYKYNFFQEIKKLEIGDEITYIVNGEQKLFRVVSNQVIKETDLSVIQDTEETKLTLITCEENKREYRRCIQAEYKM